MSSGDKGALNVSAWDEAPDSLILAGLHRARRKIERNGASLFMLKPEIDGHFQEDRKSQQECCPFGAVDLRQRNRREPAAERQQQPNRVE